MRSLAKLVGVLALLFAGYVVWSLVRDSQAKDNAAAFCGRFAGGSPMAAVTKSAQDEGDRRHRRIRDDQVMVVYIGALPFSRHICTISGQGGKVTEARVSHLD